MSRTVILNPDGIYNLSPFAMGDNVQRFCFSANDWFLQQQLFKTTAMQFGYFCLFTGCIIGIFIGWHLAKRKYGNL